MLNKAIISELKHESTSTEKILDRLPEEHFSWRPHEKSMSLKRLANHVVELTQWIPVVIKSPSFDFGTEVFPGKNAGTRQELLETLRTCVSEAVAVLENTSDEVLGERWTFKKSGILIVEAPKKVLIRQLALNHIIHHRGQLSVYLRLLNVPVPGLYGPSADEK